MRDVTPSPCRGVSKAAYFWRNWGSGWTAQFKKGEVLRRFPLTLPVGCGSVGTIGTQLSTSGYI